MKNFYGLAAIGVAFYLLFLGGCDAVQKASQDYTHEGQPIVPAIRKGVDKLLQDPIVPVLPTAKPLTLPTARIIPPTTKSQPGRVIPLPRATPQPTAQPVAPTPVPTQEVPTVEATPAPTYAPENLPQGIQIAPPDSQRVLEPVQEAAPVQREIPLPLQPLIPNTIGVQPAAQPQIVAPVEDGAPLQRPNIPDRQIAPDPNNRAFDMAG